MSAPITPERNSRVEYLLEQLIEKVEEQAGGSQIKYGGRVDTVNDLPSEGEENQFYFVGLESADNWDEYIWAISAAGETGHWDRLGSVTIIVDTVLDTTSNNPIANSAVATAVNQILAALALKANSADLARVATTGSYEDLTDKPDPIDISIYAKSAMIAAPYNSTTVYTDGDRMILNGELYVCDSVNGQNIPVGENLLVTYSGRLKDSTYGYMDNRYWESYGTPGAAEPNKGMYISGIIPLKQNTNYKIYEAGWYANQARYYALAMFTNNAAFGSLARAFQYGYYGASATGTFNSSSHQYISLSMPKDDTQAAQYSLYELSAQKFRKVTVDSELNAVVTVTQTGDIYVGSQLVRKKLTQAEYDALVTKDPKVDYLIIEETEGE